MMKKVILLRSNQIQGDSRVEKYLSFFKEKGIDYKVLGWDRTNVGIEDSRILYCKRKSGYAVGGIKAMYNRLFWFIYVIRTLCKMKEKPVFIHACDLDTAFPAALYKFFFNRKVFVLFDVFDWASHALSSQCNKFILFSIKSMESFSLKYSNKIFICEDERKAQIPNFEKYDISVLPNIPMITNEENIKVTVPEYVFDNNKITFSYVGWFGNARFLEELLDLVDEGRINLLIAGYGRGDLEKRCIELSNRDNIKYFGRVPYVEGLKIMYNSDIVYAMYCKSIKNHYFAAPNKYYEVMFLRSED